MNGSRLESLRIMKSPLRWFDRETGLVTTVGNWLQRPIAGGPAWRFVWPHDDRLLVPRAGDHRADDVDVL